MGDFHAPLLDTGKLEVVERLPGWFGRYFHSEQMTFAHYDFKRGASIHEHFHPQEEVYEVIEGELQLTIDGVAHLARPGVVAIVPPNARHSVKALTEGARSSSILRAAANSSAPATAEESRRAPLCTLLS